MLKTVINWIDAYAVWGQPDLTPSAKSRNYAFTLACLLGGASGCVYFLFYWIYDRAIFGGDGLDVMQWSALATLGFVLYPATLRFGPIVMILLGLLFTVPIFVWMGYVLGSGSGMHLFLILVLSNCFLFLGYENRSASILVSVLTASVAVFMLFAFPEPSDLVRVNDRFIRIVQATVLCSIVAQLLFTHTALAAQLGRAEAALAREHARSEALLQNLLPDEIAARLKDRPGEVIADGLPAVTLLFADIVDFTPRAAKGRPEEVVAFLNRIFSEFDRLTAERSLEKIKTIGDAYMVASGLPTARADHAAIIADMALAMREAAARLSHEMGERVALRIGIHSGPAIAGVIGTSKVFYDVWGDTVNMASRMESHGAPSRIQITAETRALLGDDFCVRSRGAVEIKGVGETHTYWLDGRVG